MVLALGSTAEAASADAGAPSNPPRTPSRNGPRNAIGVYPLALLSPGFALEYERFVAPPRVSFASGIGFIRGAARGDYRSSTLTPSMELRLWLTGRGPFSTLADRAMVGAYFSLREEMGFTATTDEVRDRLAGRSVEFGSALSCGYRLTLGPMALTPSSGAAVLTQLDPSGRLTSTTTVVARFAAALGILF